MIHDTGVTLLFEDMARLDTWEFEELWRYIGKVERKRALAKAAGSDAATPRDATKSEPIQQEVERLESPEPDPQAGAPSVEAQAAVVDSVPEPAEPDHPAEEPHEREQGPFAGTCAICSRGFDTRYARGQHLRRQHPLPPPLPSAPRQDIPRSADAGDVCRWCSKQCGGEAARKTHESYCEARPMAKRQEGEHVHHWKMDPPNGPIIHGSCECGATRQDPASPVPRVGTGEHHKPASKVTEPPLRRPRPIVSCEDCGLSMSGTQALASHRRSAHKAAAS